MAVQEEAQLSPDELQESIRAANSSDQNGKHPSNMHTVFLGDCTVYFQWMSMGMFYSHKKSGQPGPITRVMCCTEEQEATLPKEWLALGPTHIARSMAVNPHNQDQYSAYNKPYAVIDFLTRAPPQEEWLVLLDSDMQLRLPFICGGTEFENPEADVLEIDCVRGHPIAAYYGYLIGATNELAVRHIPNVLPRNDTSGGQPEGRRSDQVGGIFIVHRDDMREYMTDWLSITEDVRFDPEAWHLSGDVYSTRAGMKPWISEMYGYSFAAAKHDMWHTIDRVSMMYPGYLPSTPPRLIHYGLNFSIESREGEYSFDKHWHYHFNPFSCQVSTGTASEGGLFPMLPSVGKERLRDLISMETIMNLNEAFCEHHRRECVPEDAGDEPAILRQCDKVQEAAVELREEYYRIGNVRDGQAGALCGNDAGDAMCNRWASQGVCSSNAGYMSGSCVKACNLCYPTLPAAELRRRQGTEESDSVEGRAIERQDPDAPHVEDVSPPLGTLSIVDGAKDIGNLATARGGGTAPDVIRAPKRHADTVSEDESSMELVELLRGSEEDPEEVVAEQHAPVVISSQSDVEVDNVEIKAPKIYIHDSVPIMVDMPAVATKQKLRAEERHGGSITVLGKEAPSNEIIAYGIGGVSVWVLLVVGILFLQTISRRRREMRHRSSSLLPSLSPRDAYTVPSMAHHL